MPSTLVQRRQHGFRPMTYTDRHREIVRLATLGFRQVEIARSLHCSRSHVSRIVNMPEAHRDAEEFGNQLMFRLSNEVMARMTQ